MLHNLNTNHCHIAVTSIILGGLWCALLLEATTDKLDLLRGCCDEVVDQLDS